MASSKNLFVAAFAAVAILATMADESCPPANDIAPCTCDGEGFNCMGDVTMDQMRRAFRARFKYGGVRNLWIQATRITHVPADLFNNIQVQEAYIEVNNLTSFDLASLHGAKSNLYVLSLYGNGLRDFDFPGLNEFQVMSTLNLGNNKITTIPDNGVQSKYLRTLILAQNEISYIGRNAFVNAPNLNALELMQNRLKTLGPRSLVLKATLPRISVVSNEISTIDPTAFEDTAFQLIRLSANKLTHLKKEVFGSVVSKMPHDGVIEVYSNPFTCRGCDYSWLLNDKTRYEKVFLGFYCQSGGNIGSLTKERIGC